MKGREEKGINEWNEEEVKEEDAVDSSSEPNN
jgi:hypothetical protein